MYTPTSHLENQNVKLILPFEYAHNTQVHLPPYAINAFYPLHDLTETNGATEFTLGSHMCVFASVLSTYRHSPFCMLVMKGGDRLGLTTSRTGSWIDSF